MGVSDQQVVVSVINLAKADAQPPAPVLEKKRRVSTTVVQVVSCCLALSMQLCTGLGMGFSSTLIPQLEAEGSDLRLSRDESAWITSVFNVAGPAGSLVGGWVMSSIGRLRAVQLSNALIAASWVVIAMAQSFEELIAGRLVMGASVGMAYSAAVLFATEVANKNIRGGVVCLGTAFASCGVLVTYVVGAYVPWRAAAWGFSVLPVLMLAALFAGHDSPVWLMERGREAAARKAALYFYDDADKIFWPAKEAEQTSETSFWQKMKFLCCKPTGLKPFIMINVLFILQQFCGVYITIYYAVTFFEESGSELDPYVASIVIAVLRLVCSTGTALSAGSLGRRPVLLVSTLGMGVSMIGSALATQQILGTRQGGGVPEAWLSYAVVACILLYITFSSMGLTILPWSMMAEVFPHEVRGIAQPINMAGCSIYAFLTLQRYPAISNALGGSVGVQFLFAGSSFLVAAFVWAFVVETRGLALEEIEEYFSKNTFYPGRKPRVQNSVATAA